MASDLVKNVGSLDFDSEVIKATETVVVDFWAEWCGPCKMLAPLLEEIAKEHVGTIKVVKVNVDQEAALSAKYGIQSIPTLYFFKAGQSVGKHIGLSSKKDLLNKIQSFA
jgi:thioredoxin 1